MSDALASLCLVTSMRIPIAMHRVGIRYSKSPKFLKKKGMYFEVEGEIMIVSKKCKIGAQHLKKDYARTFSKKL